MDVSKTRRREIILAMGGIALVLFLVSLDQTIVSTAMPKVIAELNGFALYGWIATAYLLAETIAIPIVGKLGDLYGRKWIVVGGTLGFLITSALCGMATSMAWLIVGRGLQGLAAGTIMATVFTLVADIFPDLRDRARYQGILFAVFAFSSVAGPLLGGWITDQLGWRWIFYVNIPLGALTLFVLPRVLPQSPRVAGARIDYAGAATITVMIAALLLALELVGAGTAWTSPLVIGGLVIGVAALAVFVVVERRAIEPIIPLELFQNRTIVAMSILLFLFGIGMFGLTLYTPLFVQGVLGASASASGTVMIPMVLTMTVMGIIIGQVIARFGTLRPFLIGGTGVMVLGVFLLTTLNTDSSSWLVSLYLFVTALGMGTVMPVTTLVVQSTVEPRMLGVATSATQFIRSIGATVGTAVIGTLVTSTYVTEMRAQAPVGVSSEIINTLSSPNALVSQEALERLADLMAQIPNGTELMQSLLTAARAGLMSGIHRGFVFTLIAMVLAFGSCFLIGQLQLSESEPQSVHA